MHHNDDTIKTSDSVLKKNIPLILLKRLCVRGSWRLNRTATYWPPLLWPHQSFFPVLLGCSTRGMGAQPLWDMFLIPASSVQLVWSPTDWNSCAPSYIIVRHLPSSCRRHKSYSFNPSTVKVISWYSSTGCTCYLHRWISYFDSLRFYMVLFLFIKLYFKLFFKEFLIVWMTLLFGFRFMMCIVKLLSKIKKIYTRYHE